VEITRLNAEVSKQSINTQQRIKSLKGVCMCVCVLCDVCVCVIRVCDVCHMCNMCV